MEKPALRLSGKKRVWFARSLSGSGGIAAPSARFAAEWKRLENEPEVAKRFGIVRRLVACSTIRRTREKQPLARRRLNRCAHAYGHSGDGPYNRSMLTLI